MKLGTCIWKEKSCLVVVFPEQQKVVLLDELGYTFKDMNQLIRESTAESLSEMQKKAEACSQRKDFSEIRWMAPIPYPTRIVGMGLNYREMSDGGEAEAAPPREYPIYWEKAVNRCQGQGEEVASHADFIHSLDCEAELGVILGRDVRRISRENVEPVIFGYTVVNDMTALELIRHKQNYYMKSLDATCPIGPWIVTADEICYPPELQVRCWVNNVLEYDGNTRDLLFDIPYIISDLTRGMTLPAGTIIATGSPDRLPSRKGIPMCLKDGDICRCEVEKIGTMENRVSDQVLY